MGLVSADPGVKQGLGFAVRCLRCVPSPFQKATSWAAADKQVFKRGLRGSSPFTVPCAVTQAVKLKFGKSVGQSAEEVFFSLLLGAAAFADQCDYGDGGEFVEEGAGDWFEDAGIV